MKKKAQTFKLHRGHLKFQVNGILTNLKVTIKNFKHLANPTELDYLYAAEDELKQLTSRWKGETHV